jgi:hypothetical protein
MVNWRSLRRVKQAPTLALLQFDNLQGIAQQVTWFV